MSDGYNGGYAPRPQALRDRQDQVRLSRGGDRPRAPGGYDAGPGGWVGPGHATPSPSGAGYPPYHDGYTGAPAPGAARAPMGYAAQPRPAPVPAHDPQWYGAEDATHGYDRNDVYGDHGGYGAYDADEEGGRWAQSHQRHQPHAQPQPVYQPPYPHDARYDAAAGYAPHDPAYDQPYAGSIPEGYANPAYQPSYQPAPQPAGQAAAPSGRSARWVNAAGALLSVALIAGVGLWTYRLMVRDVTGVPVIRALEGPMRTAADIPGGRQAAHQGLSVNAVAAAGGAAPAPEQIVIAPPPVQLRPEDLAIAAPAPVGTSVAAPAPVLVAEATPLSPAEPATTETAIAADAPITVIPASAPGVVRSPVPPVRPATRAAPVAAIAQVAAPAPQSGGTDAQAEAVLQDLVTRLATPQVTEIDPSTLPPGTRLVQFGPYASADEARMAWNELARRFPGTLDGRGRIIEEASAGGRLFYRLRAHGFDDEPQARRFCALFEAGGVDCITTLIR